MELGYVHVCVNLMVLAYSKNICVVDPTDFDECSADDSLCGPEEYTECTNLPGGYSCNCTAEYGYFYVADNLPCTTGQLNQYAWDMEGAHVGCICRVHMQDAHAGCMVTAIAAFLRENNIQEPVTMLDIDYITHHATVM